jgi:hypothetical protein
MDFQYCRRPRLCIDADGTPIQIPGLKLISESKINHSKLKIKKLFAHFNLSGAAIEPSLMTTMLQPCQD